MNKLGILLGVAIAAGCSAPAVETRRDDQVDLSRYKTYQWLSEGDAKALKLDNPTQVDFITGYSTVKRRADLEPRLKTVVDDKLKAMGFSAALGGPDFFVTYFGKAKDEDWVSTFNGRVPSIENVPLVMFPGFDRSAAHAYVEGTLLLVFYDPRTKSPVWTGSMSRALEGKELNLGTVTAALERILSEFEAG
jgi:hypothetical protein